MKNQIILVGLAALLVGIIGGYALSKSESYEPGWMMFDWNKGGKVALDNDEVANNNNMHSMHNMGNGAVTTERKFLEEMIPHHQEAVDTAKQVIARGNDPEAKKLAENIVAAQEKEIADMKAWYKLWYNETYTNTGVYKPMMRDLTTLSGTELDKVFLEDMIMHHMGALMMAQGVSPYTEHKEIRTLIENIAETQSSEIITMRIILKQL